MTAANFADVVRSISPNEDIIISGRRSDEQGELRKGSPTEQEVLDAELQMMEILVN